MQSVYHPFNDYLKVQCRNKTPALNIQLRKSKQKSSRILIFSISRDSRAGETTVKNKFYFVGVTFLPNGTKIKSQKVNGEKNEILLNFFHILFFLCTT